jgi:hypothetical protein
MPLKTLAMAAALSAAFGVHAAPFDIHPARPIEGTDTTRPRAAERLRLADMRSDRGPRALQPSWPIPPSAEADTCAR